jgi:hypothetical protein
MREAYSSRNCDHSYALGEHAIHKENGKKINREKDNWQPSLDAIKATIL